MRWLGLLAVLSGWAMSVSANERVVPMTEPMVPLRGTLLIAGGGPMPDSVTDTFAKLAGGPEARLVLIPTASGKADSEESEKTIALWKSKGIQNIVRLHTRDRDEANKPELAAKIAEATAVWIGGGKQILLLDAYRGTAVERELHKLLDRGGIIGGTSAGAAVMSKLCITSGNVVANTSEGFGFLPGGVVDQHFIQRNRADRLLEVLHKYPGWYGLAIDEQTAALVQGREVRALGKSLVLTLLSGTAHRPASVTFLKEGEKADLLALQRAALLRAQGPFPPAQPATPRVNKGSLVIVGGGGTPEDAWTHFLKVAGGERAKIVVIPTALDNPLIKEPGEAKKLRAMMPASVTVWHASTRDQANDSKILEPLQQATGLWFCGGRQWRLVDAYQGTQAEKAMHAILARGGAVGGSSAGASIQGDYMVRGDPLGNTKMMAEGYERGLGFLPGVAIDQHFFARKRTADMTDLMTRYPQLLGFGIDESTALIVEGEMARVVGKSGVAVYDRRVQPTTGTDYLLLKSGQRFDLKSRSILSGAGE